MPGTFKFARHSWILLYVLLVSGTPNFVLRLEADPQVIEAGHGCSLIKYANGTVFKENLDTVFSLLAENISSTGFATASSGKGVDGVYGLAQCRKDLSMEDCNNCFAAATEQIVRYCPVEIGARMIFDGCFLRYENHTFFDQALDAGNSNVCISDSSSRPEIFNQTVQNLLAEIKSKALRNEGFATDEIRAKGLPTTIYALAMCRPTLSTNSCDVCLHHATRLVERCFSLQDGRGLDAGCFLRYSTIAFFTTPSSSSSHSKSRVILVGTLGGAAFIAILWLLFIFRRSFRKMYTKVPGRSQDEEAEAYFAAEEDPKGDHLFKYDSLRAATNNFDQSMKLGEGGFGKVYKGIFRDGQEVAVKKLLVQHSTNTLVEFVTEVKLISAVRHRNLVRLLGCCRRGTERLLVYEFIPNTSLDRHLFANTSKPLSWKTRFEIILGTAHGLAYLNEESPLRILHRDIKAANILLDNDFQAKIADFGLARLFPDDLTHLTTRVGGTIGYTAPEYAVHGQLTEKVDVYSYGMLVLEIVSGRKYTDPILPAQMELLLGWIQVQASKVALEVAHLQELLTHWGNAPCTVARVPPDATADASSSCGRRSRRQSARHSHTPRSQGSRHRSPSGGRGGWWRRSASPPRGGSGWQRRSPSPPRGGSGWTPPPPPGRATGWSLTPPPGRARADKFSRLSLPISPPRPDVQPATAPDAAIAPDAADTADGWTVPSPPHNPKDMWGFHDRDEPPPSAGTALAA